MEKKNTILLTVIAVATLLVAVVGATFAYFTASVTTTGDNDNATTQLKTKALASASMDLGSKVPSTDDPVYPGYAVVKTVKVSGSGEANSEDVKANIVLTPNVPSVFGNHIEWELYSAPTTEADDEVTCTNAGNVQPTQTEDGYKYEDDAVCTNGTATKVSSGTFTGTTVKEIPVTVSSTTRTTYYLVVKYVNDTENPQNEEQGKTFSVKIDFKQVNE